MTRKWRAITGLAPVIALLTVYPFLWYPTGGDAFHYPKFVGLIVIAVVCSVLCAACSDRPWRRVQAVAGWQFGLGALILITASTVLSPTPLLAMRGAPYRHTGLITYVCLAVILSCCLSAVRAQDSRLLLTLFFLSGVALATVAVVQFTMGTLIHTITLLSDTERNTYAATAGNVDFLAAYLLMTGIAGVAISSGNQAKWLVSLGLLITQLVIILSLCRGVWAAELAVMPWLLRGQKPRKILVAITAVIAMLVVFLALSGAARDRVCILGRLVTKPNLVTGDRLYFWQRSLDELSQSTVKEFLVGTGPDTFRARVPDLYGKTPVVDKPHNVYLDYLLCLGVPATVMILVFIAGVCLAPQGKDLARYCKLIILAYWVQALFGIDAILVLPCQAVILALLAVMARSNPKSRMTNRKKIAEEYS